MKWWAFIQSLECSKCASASSSGFPENSGLKFDQFICKVTVQLHHDSVAAGFIAGSVLPSD